MSLFITFLSGAGGAALVAGIFAIIQYKIKKRDEKNDKDDVVKKALQYVMLYIIEERCKEHIEEGKISLNDLRRIHKWHSLYHVGLEGNGDADALLEKVEKLRLITD